MLSINTNLPSIIAQSSLKKSTLKLNTAVERMSTGFKINHAKDNAANYSISTNMTTKIGAYQIAEDNCAMGLDLITTASESLDLINDKLVRLRALAEQAANGTYGNQSLKAINAEANALVDEIERSFKNTEYNGINLFGEGKLQFIDDVAKRNTDSMTSFSDVSESTTISGGTYSISTTEELAKLATMTNNGKVTGGEFVLANDIDLKAYSTGVGWTPIGNSAHPFGGTFDGNGYVISNLYINRAGEFEQGLFGVSQKGTIKNLGIENFNITGGTSVGAIIGDGIMCTISNCYTSGKATGDSVVGGLIGNIEMGTTISNSYASSSVTGNTNIGGLIGISDDSTINNSYANRSVIGDNAVGGLVGLIYNSTISNSYANGSVVGNTNVGGLVGLNNNNGSTNNSYYNSDITNQNDSNLGFGIKTTELEELITNGTLSKAKQMVDPRITNFQIGINASVSSQISLDTAFAIDFNSLRGIGSRTTYYLGQIDDFIEALSTKQTEYGAAQNRLESALDEISTQYENLVSSRSTLRDADIAEVSSEYIKQQILQQASATLLSTANQTPALALQLL